MGGVQGFFEFDENSDGESGEGKERSQNVQFYNNEICSKPCPGHTIDEMLCWQGEYKKLENNHSYIQWLFPIPGSLGTNHAAQKLYENEARAIRENDTLSYRVLQSYRMMLDFYGMKLEDPNSGEVTRNHSNWKERYANLNRSTHNYRRISRILISLGELGFERFQVPWVKFLMEEAIVSGVLPNLKGDCMIHWIDAIKDPEERNQMSRYYRALLQTSRTNIKNTELPSVVSNKEPDSECGNGFRSSEDVDEAEGRSKSSKYRTVDEDNLPYGPADRYHRVNDETRTASRRERDNLKFYQNKISSKPYPGNTIEEMLRWRGDYGMLETNHQYIQWLFPIPEGRGLNRSAQSLLDDEAEEMRNDDTVMERVLKAYKMMLDFYGLQLEETFRGKIKLSPNWQERFAHLNRSGHNKMRITRILKSIGELGYERFQAPLVEFLMTEATSGSLPALNGSCMSHWIATVKDPEEQSVLYRRFNRLPVPPPVAEEALMSEDEEDDQSQGSAITPSSEVIEEKETHIQKPETVEKTGHKAENNRRVDQAIAVSGTTRKRVSEDKGSGNGDLERKLRALIVGLDDENEDAANEEHYQIHVPVESCLNSPGEESGQKPEHIVDSSESKAKPKNTELGIFKTHVENDKNTNLECQLNDPDVVHPEDRYPKSADTEKLDKNLRFYRDELLSSPTPGFSIVTMLQHKGNHKFFDDHPTYIQWLFPTRKQSSFNPESQPLQEHEIKAIREDTMLHERVLEAYRTVLDYFGMQLEDDVEGRIKPIPTTFKDRWKLINNRCLYIYSVFTRIIASLGELGFERFQVPLIQFLITEGVDHEMLPTLSGKNIMHWVDAVTDQQERYFMWQKYQTLANRSPQMTEVEAGLANLKLSHYTGQENDSKRDTARNCADTALRFRREHQDLPGLDIDISTVPEPMNIDL